MSLTERDAAELGGLYGPPPAPHVTHAAFAGDGAALATVDVRADAGAAGSAAAVLQFWDARGGGGGGGGGGFVLNTQVADPHQCAPGRVQGCKECTQSLYPQSVSARAKQSSEAAGCEHVP